jgi:hypothetical protein
MSYIPAGYVSQTQISSAVEQAVAKLGKEVARVRHSVGSNTTGEPSIFFRIVLWDWAVDEKTLGEVAERIETILFYDLHPIENWGLMPYFSFRSSSEQLAQTETEWT